MKKRSEAITLLHEYTTNPSLIKHALSVEAAMGWYAREHYKLPPEECEQWMICGLLHDFDYEKYPSSDPIEGHPYVGNKILLEKGYSAEICEAIMGHAAYTNTPRTTDMAKTLFAVDELSGLITAATLVRPDKSIHTITSKSVKKKIKDKHFAAGCNRDDIREGAEEIGVELTQHIENVIAAMKSVAKEIELEGI
jgi:predicted hydrolase (HD superfamily)